MIEIEFKTREETIFQRYVGLGGYIHTQDGLSIYFSNREMISIADWQDFFKKVDISIQLHMLNYFVLEYKQFGKSSFEQEFGKEVCTIFIKQQESIIQFVEEWFLIDSAVFKGIDLTCDELDLSNCVYDENENIIKFLLDDGSIVKVLNNDDDIRQYFVLKSNYKRFKETLDLLIGYFK